MEAKEYAAAGPWISVEEALPESGAEVLVIVAWCGYRCVMLAEYECHGRVIWWEVRKVIDYGGYGKECVLQRIYAPTGPSEKRRVEITHWMPLPELPEEGE